jgi:hypothetical protein
MSVNEDEGTSGMESGAAEAPSAANRPYHQRTYLGLLVFVVALGVPMISLPFARHRLESRVEVLRAAPDYLAKLDLPKPKMQVVISDAGGVTSVRRSPIRIVPSDEASSGAGQKPAAQSQVSETTGSAPPGGPVYQKGTGEQEAYDLLVNAHKVLAGMLKGSDPSLKFQDWGAAAVGENSYNIMVTFVRTADNVPQRYIWNIKPLTKEITPVSSLAMSISR